MKQNLTKDELDLFKKDYESDPSRDIQAASLRTNGINNSSINYDLMRKLKNTFSIDIDTGKVTNQRRSGRCWMFAGLNVLRQIVKKALNLKEFELSQAYLQFYDKLEKANFYLEQAIDKNKESYDSRDNTFIIESIAGDGGHFTMFTNLVKKYGVVPSVEMPDYAVSKNTSELNALLTDYLAQAIMELRDASNKKATKAVLRTMKEGYLNDVYRILVMSLGKPVTSFVLEVKDKDDKFTRSEELTPLEFYKKYIERELDDYIPLCNAPIRGMKDFQKYTSDLVNNVEGGDSVIFFNVPLKKMKEAVIASLKDSEPVWFGADVSSQSLRQEGYLADGILKSDELFHLNYHMNKGQRLMYRASFCNHAMTLTGVNLVDEKPNRWKVQNSWGNENGMDGYYVMSDQWFDEYVYEVFVNKKYIDPKIVDKYNASTVIKQDPYNTLWLYMK